MGLHGFGLALLFVVAPSLMLRILWSDANLPKSQVAGAVQVATVCIDSLGGLIGPLIGPAVYSSQGEASSFPTITTALAVTVLVSYLPVACLLRGYSELPVVYQKEKMSWNERVEL